MFPNGNKRGLVFYNNAKLLNYLLASKYSASFFAFQPHLPCAECRPGRYSHLFRFTLTPTLMLRLVGLLV